jgi:hypothetical protein
LSSPSQTSNQTIEILVSPSGQAVVQTRGFAGSSCRQASQFVEKALGEATSETLTAEFYQQQTSREHLQQRQS